MRRLIVQQWVTADNIAAEEDGGLSFVTGEPFDDEVTDNPFQNSLMGFIDSVDTTILGANTYNMAKNYWPNADDQGEYGRKLNNLTKYVASSKLEGAPLGRLSGRHRDPRSGRHDPGAQGAERQEPLAVGKLEAHALPDARRRRRRDPDAGLPGLARHRDARLRGPPGP